jgi:5'-AMP-activated protein kinase regulatory gamma subunit
MPSFMKKKLGDIQNEIGTYGNIHVVRPDTPVISALSLFVENRVSALPIVDEEGRIIDIYAKFDAIVSYFNFY